MTAEAVAQRCDPRARRSGGGWVARCPAHADRTPSLSVRDGRGGRVLIRCWAGCATRDVLEALGLSFREIMGAPPTPAERRAGADRRRTAQAEWLRCMARAVAVIERRHPGHPDLVALRRKVARDLGAHGGVA